MGTIRTVEPVKLICGIIAAGPEVLAAAQERLRTAFGPVDVESPVWPFDFTDYYATEMGGGLLRRLIAFEQPIDPGRLAAIKRQTNDLEGLWAAPSPAGLRRRINLDPGYVTASKLVLATTKNFAHRIYLADGIYAEVTLTFRKGGCDVFPWTYPDFKSGRYTEFLLEVRRRALALAGAGGIS